jgi:hypothetical protein
MAPKVYRIKVGRGDTQFEAEGDRKFVLEMIARFAQTETTEKKLQPADKTEGKSRSVATSPVSKKMAVGEFIRQIGFKKHTDLVLAFGYYLEKVKGVASFTPADINTCYYEAKLESSNTSQMIIQNIRRGYMMSAKKDKDKGMRSYVLTRSGEEHVEKKPAKSEK